MAAVVGSMLLQRSPSTSRTGVSTAAPATSADEEDEDSQQTTYKSDYNSNTARKRRKYVPGGPGGGGRFVNVGDAANDYSRDSQTPPLPSTTARRRTTARRTQQPSHQNHSNRLVSSSPMRSPARRPSRRDSVRDRQGTHTPTYDSAAEAAAAAVQSDGYKPREERSWEEFHPHLDLDAKIAVFSADEVDGVMPESAQQRDEDQKGSARQMDPAIAYTTPQPIRRRGRPPRRPESMLSGLGSPPAQKIVPLPAQNPRERLTLPKPSYRKVEAFTVYEMDKEVSQNYVDQAMANVGYQKNDLYQIPEKQFIRLVQNSFGDNTEDSIHLEADTVESEGLPPPPAPTVGQVEYDMDEQDQQWLHAHNATRKGEGVEAIRPQIFEITMTQIEKEWHALEKRIPKPNPKPPQTQRPRSSSAAAVNGEPAPGGEEQDSKCAVCDDGDCENTNAIVFCDGCDLAVHQECYGVPFIPEGQWLCRKCQLVGRATPTCIFCPNTDGAFKLTQESRWAHLLCAIWIPEVSLANATFMEPIVDVASVPKQRWKLNCYICHQKMGACIQCGNRNCFQAFHVTCARRAKLFLKMKPPQGGPATFDSSVLKAFCDKHIPSEWRREHGVERTTIHEAKAFYRREMRGRKWADSQQSALALVPTQQAFQPIESIETVAADEGSAAQKKKREQAQKNVWRLPSGAPIVPHIVLNNVGTSLQRFTLRGRKEFVAEACKYWTLKREARRGAALLKRLQLQMETFSTMEIARRNFAGMGAAGGPKLQRRIEFAEELEKQMDTLLSLCDSIKEREALKVQDAELLREAVDAIYFPIVPLLWPVLRKAQSLDAAHNVFTEQLKELQRKLELRKYASVSAFSADLGSTFRSVAGLDAVNDAVEAHTHLAGVSLKDASLTNDQKEVKKLAKRIVKAIHQPLQDALKSEAELARKPFEKELHRLDAILGGSIEESTTDAPVSGPEEVEDTMMIDAPADGDDVLGSGIKRESSPDSLSTSVSLMDTDTAILPEVKNESLPPNNNATPQSKSPNVEAAKGANASSSSTELTTERAAAIPQSHHHPPMATPLTPPVSEKELLAPLSQGGIPWYLAPFDPVGTTIHDERWTGREVLRGMSEELSEIDEEELEGLGVDVEDGSNATPSTMIVDGGSRHNHNDNEDDDAEEELEEESKGGETVTAASGAKKTAATTAARRRKRKKGW